MGGGLPQCLVSCPFLGVPTSSPRYPHPVPIGGGYPSQVSIGYPIPHWDWMGVSPVRTRWGYPHRDWMGGTPRKQNSRVSTCYATGGMPLVFKQEDFLAFFFKTSVGHLDCVNSESEKPIAHTGEKARHQRSPKQGYQWPYIKELCPPKI